METTESMEAVRMGMTAAINAAPGSREALEIEHGQVWDTNELSADYVVEAFAAPFVIVTKKSSGKRGSLMFQDRPRFYFSFNKTEE